MLQTNTVKNFTLVLLKEIQQLPLLKELRLVGGTALALQLGHRNSIDLDFFGKIDANHETIVVELNKLGHKVSSMQDSKIIHQFLVGKIKIDIVNYPYEWIDNSIEEDGVKMASLKDIAAMKLSAITNRGTKKDFIDIYTLLKHFTLKEMFTFYEEKYKDGSIFNVIRSLSYFEDAEENPMPKMFAKTDWKAVKAVIQKAVKDELRKA
ncbi:hypothetical protein AGMMS49938_18530 [Fibrobacterales bacterium]|nr:hypothetical protein AGMMS49938_18530 [Fibrobacterales bacterium]